MKIIRLKSLPTPLTLMMLAILLAAIATWLLPAGEYSKVASNNGQSFTITTADGTQSLPYTQHTLDSLSINIPIEKFTRGEIRKAVSVPGTYRQLRGQPQGIVAILEAPVKGIVDSIDIALFVLFIGGFMSIFNKTGAMFRGVAHLAQRMKGKERLLMVILVFIFSFLGGSYGMDVEAIVFYPVLVPLFLAAGYDLMVPLAIVFGGAAVGYAASFTNPFNVIIASNTAGINWIDGLYERLLFFFVTTILFTWYVLRYAARVKKDPSQSIILQTDGDTRSPFELSVATAETKTTLDAKTNFLLLIFLLTFSSMIMGIVFFDWWTTEMSALFFGSAILVGIVDRMKEKTFVTEFVSGAQNLLGVALIIGLARGVTVILNDGLVADSILYYASNLVQHFSPAIFILLVMIFYFFFVVLVSSSSGMAVLTMPIIGALAIIMHIPGREIVNAYMWGIGAMFLISPTGSVFPSLLMVQVSYKAWLKFIMPFLILLLIITALFLIVGINY